MLSGFSDAWSYWILFPLRILELIIEKIVESLLSPCPLLEQLDSIAFSYDASMENSFLAF